MDGVETHAHHPHASGHRIFDFVISGSAVQISCVSLFVAVQHGRTMEKLVEANSFPNLEVDGNIESTDKAGQIALGVSVENTGVGPGRVETLELWENGTPVRSAGDFAKAIKAAHGLGHGGANLEGASVIGNLIGAGKTKTIVSFRFEGAKEWYPALTRVLFGMESRVCYCSVFDECHVSDSRVQKGRPRPVGRCATPPAPYDDDLSKIVNASATKGPALDAAASSEIGQDPSPTS